MSVLDAFAVPGRVAVVTGGNRGLGRAFPHALGEAGARVAVVARDAAASETVLGELRAKGVDAEAFPADVRDRTALGAAAARVMDRLGAVDILANNAGTCIHRPALELTDAAWREVIDVNLTGLWNRCPVFGQLMVEAGAGVIVNVGSMSGEIVNRPQGQPAYTPPRPGVHHLTKSLAAEWGALRRAGQRGRPRLCAHGDDVDRQAGVRGSMDRRRATATRRRPGGDRASRFLPCEPGLRLHDGAVLVIDGGYTVF